MPDFITEQPDDIKNINLDQMGDWVLAAMQLNAWLAAQANNMPDAATFDPNAGVPHFIRDGFRNFTLKMVPALKIYLRAAPIIDSFLSPGCVAALHALAVFIGELEIADQAGPN